MLIQDLMEYHSLFSYLGFDITFFFLNIYFQNFY